MNISKPFNALLLASLVVACAEQSGSQHSEMEQPKASDSTGQAQPQPQHEIALVDEDRPTRFEASSAVQANQSPIEEQAAPSHHRKVLAKDMAIQSIAGVHYRTLDTQVERENYLQYDGNGVFQVTQNPVSTFSVDVDTAGYANVRRMLVKEGRLPPSDAVRLEEMVNYFSYSYEIPQPDAHPFTINTELAPAPWSDDHHLLQIGLKGFEPKAEQRPAANLVFLVDVSGSMQSADKLGLVKKSLRLLVNKMTAEDRIALAVYAGAAGVVLESTPGNEKAKILAAIDGLQAGGSTHGSAGIKLAYALAEQYKIEGGINRVVIASDGDMNVGTVDMEALKNLVESKRKTGVALSTLGFGSGN
jgi:Ca-activated chloride channel family protein